MNKARRAPPWDRIDTVILDMDGTLLDLYFDTQVWTRVLPERFASAAGLSIDDARAEVGRRLDDARGTLDWYCLDYWSGHLGIDVAALEREFADLVTPRPGAIAFLEQLHHAPQRTVLATNAHPSGMQRKFDRTGIDRYFDEIASSHHFGDCKESQHFWHELCGTFAIDPSTALLIDDNHTVLGAAQRFGVEHVYGVQLPDTRGPAKTSGEFYCLDSFDELELDNFLIVAQSAPGS